MLRFADGGEARNMEIEEVKGWKLHPLITFRSMELFIYKNVNSLPYFLV